MCPPPSRRPTTVRGESRFPSRCASSGVGRKRRPGATSWNSRSGWGMPFRRRSPASRTSTPSPARSLVAWESTTWPPCAAAQMRAPRVSNDTDVVATSLLAPARRCGRRSERAPSSLGGHSCSASARCAAAAAFKASRARSNATKTRHPACRPRCRRSQRMPPAAGGGAPRVIRRNGRRGAGQAGSTLDVREEERDGPVRQLRHRRAPSGSADQTVRHLRLGDHIEHLLSLEVEDDGVLGVGILPGSRREPTQGSGSN